MPEHTLALLARDLETENEALEKFIEEGRLEVWWNGIVDAASLSAREEADRAGEQESELEIAESKLLQRMAKSDKERWGVEGAPAFHRLDLDEDGDISMGM